jgi:DNA-binding IclR family transcriptional regulator
MNTRRAVHAYSPLRENEAAGSIPRAARILECISCNINSISDIARHCGYAKSTVHRVLKILENSHIVTEDPTESRYYLGPLIAKITINPSIVHEYLVRCAAQEMKNLSVIFEEMVTLDVMLGIQTFPLYEIPSPQEIRVVDSGSKKIGLLYIGASAKVLLSQLNDERLAVALKYLKLSKITERTVTDKRLLISQILAIRQEGYCLTNGEIMPGGICISAPVYNYTSPVCISVIGPEYRLRNRQSDVIKRLITSSNIISRDVLKIFSNIRIQNQRITERNPESGLKGEITKVADPVS